MLSKWYLFILDFPKCIMFHSFILILMMVDFHLKDYDCAPLLYDYLIRYNFGEKGTKYKYTSVCICVYVCMRERERLVTLVVSSLMLSRG